MTESGGGVERLHDLLIKRALWGIDTGEARELARLGLQFPDVDLAFVDDTVALLDAIELGPSPSIPGNVREAIDASLPSEALGTLPPANRSGPLLPWLAAAALGIVAVLGWLRPFTPTSTGTVRTSPAIIAPVVAGFRPGSDASGAQLTGQVRWDAVAQTGQLELVGLLANDPTQNQYQLWIVDDQRDAGFPVDGGVFDASQGPIVVPVRAALGVGEASAFVITLERPGGVVVSAQDRVVGIARVN